MDQKNEWWRLPQFESFFSNNKRQNGGLPAPGMAPAIGGGVNAGGYGYTGTGPDGVRQDDRRVPHVGNGSFDAHESEFVFDANSTQAIGPDVLTAQMQAAQSGNLDINKLREAIGQSPKPGFQSGGATAHRPITPGGSNVFKNNIHPTQKSTPINPIQIGTTNPVNPQQGNVLNTNVAPDANVPNQNFTVPDTTTVNKLNAGTFTPTGKLVPHIGPQIGGGGTGADSAADALKLAEQKKQETIKKEIGTAPDISVPVEGMTLPVKEQQTGKQSKAVVKNEFAILDARGNVITQFGSVKEAQEFMAKNKDKGYKMGPGRNFVVRDARGNVIQPFKTIEEAQAFIAKNQNKGYRIGPYNQQQMEETSVVSGDDKIPINQQQQNELQEMGITPQDIMDYFKGLMTGDNPYYNAIKNAVTQDIGGAGAAATAAMKQEAVMQGWSPEQVASLGIGRQRDVESQLSETIGGLATEQMSMGMEAAGQLWGMTQDEQAQLNWEKQFDENASKWEKQFDYQKLTDEQKQDNWQKLFDSDDKKFWAQFDSAQDDKDWNKQQDMVNALIAQGGAENYASAAKMLGEMFPNLDIDFSNALSAENAGKFENTMGGISKYLASGLSAEETIEMLKKDGSFANLGMSDKDALDFVTSMEMAQNPIWQTNKFFDDLVDSGLITEDQKNEVMDFVI